MPKPKTLDEVEPTYTITEASERIGVSRPTLYKLISQGHIRVARRKGTQLRRIPESELAAWLQGELLDSPGSRRCA